MFCHDIAFHGKLPQLAGLTNVLIFDTKKECDHYIKKLELAYPVYFSSFKNTLQRIDTTTLVLNPEFFGISEINFKYSKDPIASHVRSLKVQDYALFFWKLEGVNTPMYETVRKVQQSDLEFMSFHDPAIAVFSPLHNVESNYNLCIQYKSNTKITTTVLSTVQVSWFGSLQTVTGSRDHLNQDVEVVNPMFPSCVTRAVQIQFIYDIDSVKEIRSILLQKIEGIKVKLRSSRQRRDDAFHEARNLLSEMNQTYPETDEFETISELNSKRSFLYYVNRVSKGLLETPMQTIRNSLDLGRLVNLQSFIHTEDVWQQVFLDFYNLFKHPMKRVPFVTFLTLGRYRAPIHYDEKTRSRMEQVFNNGVIVLEGSNFLTQMETIEMEFDFNGKARIFETSMNINYLGRDLYLIYMKNPTPFPLEKFLMMYLELSQQGRWENTDEWAVYVMPAANRYQLNEFIPMLKKFEGHYYIVDAMRLQNKFHKKDLGRKSVPAALLSTVVNAVMYSQPAFLFFRVIKYIHVMIDQKNTIYTSGNSIDLSKYIPNDGQRYYLMIELENIFKSYRQITTNSLTFSYSLDSGITKLKFRNYEINRAYVHITNSATNEIFSTVEIIVDRKDGKIPNVNVYSEDVEKATGQFFWTLKKDKNNKEVFTRFDASYLFDMFHGKKGVVQTQVYETWKTYQTALDMWNKYRFYFLNETTLSRLKSEDVEKILKAESILNSPYGGVLGDDGIWRRVNAKNYYFKPSIKDVLPTVISLYMPLNRVGAARRDVIVNTLSKFDLTLGSWPRIFMYIEYNGLPLINTFYDYFRSNTARLRTYQFLTVEQQKKVGLLLMKSVQDLDLRNAKSKYVYLQDDSPSSTVFVDILNDVKFEMHPSTSVFTSFVSSFQDLDTDILLNQMFGEHDFFKTIDEVLSTIADYRVRIQTVKEFYNDFFSHISRYMLTPGGLLELLRQKYYKDLTRVDMLKFSISSPHQIGMKLFNLLSEKFEKWFEFIYAPLSTGHLSSTLSINYNYLRILCSIMRINIFLFVPDVMPDSMYYEADYTAELDYHKGAWLPLNFNINEGVSLFFLMTASTEASYLSLNQTQRNNFENIIGLNRTRNMITASSLYCGQLFTSPNLSELLVSPMDVFYMLVSASTATYFGLFGGLNSMFKRTLVENFVPHFVSEQRPLSPLSGFFYYPLHDISYDKSVINDLMYQRLLPNDYLMRIAETNKNQLRKYYEWVVMPFFENPLNTEGDIFSVEQLTLVMLGFIILAEAEQGRDRLNNGKQSFVACRMSAKEGKQGLYLKNSTNQQPLRVFEFMPMMHFPEGYAPEKFNLAYHTDRDSDGTHPYKVSHLGTKFVFFYTSADKLNFQTVIKSEELHSTRTGKAILMENVTYVARVIFCKTKFKKHAFLDDDSINVPVYGCARPFVDSVLSDGPVWRLLTGFGQGVKLTDILNNNKVYGVLYEVSHPGVEQTERQKMIRAGSSIGFANKEPMSISEIDTSINENTFEAPYGYAEPRRNRPDYDYEVACTGDSDPNITIDRATDIDGYMHVDPGTFMTISLTGAVGIIPEVERYFTDITNRLERVEQSALSRRDLQVEFNRQTQAITAAMPVYDDSELQRKVDAIQTRVDALPDAIYDDTDLRSKVDDVQATANSIETKVDGIPPTDLSGVEQSVRDLAAELNTPNTGINAKITETQNSIAGMIATVEELKNTIEFIKTSNSNEYQQFYTSSVAVGQQLQELTQKLDVLDINALKTENNAAFQALTNAFDNLSTNVNAIATSQSIPDLTSALAGVNTEINQMRTALNKMDETIGKKEYVQSVTTELTKVQKSVDKVSKNLSSLKQFTGSRLQTLNSSVKYLTKKVEESPDKFWEKVQKNFANLKSIKTLLGRGDANELKNLLQNLAKKDDLASISFDTEKVKTAVVEAFKENPTVVNILSSLNTIQENYNSNAAEIKKALEQSEKHYTELKETAKKSIENLKNSAKVEIGEYLENSRLSDDAILEMLKKFQTSIVTSEETFLQQVRNFEEYLKDVQTRQGNVKEILDELIGKSQKLRDLFEGEINEPEITEPTFIEFAEAVRETANTYSFRAQTIKEKLQSVDSKAQKVDDKLIELLRTVEDIRSRSDFFNQLNERLETLGNRLNLVRDRLTETASLGDTLATKKELQEIKQSLDKLKLADNVPGDIKIIAEQLKPLNKTVSELIERSSNLIASQVVQKLSSVTEVTEAFQQTTQEIIKKLKESSSRADEALDTLKKRADAASFRYIDVQQNIDKFISLATRAESSVQSLGYVLQRLETPLESATTTFRTADATFQQLIQQSRGIQEKYNEATEYLKTSLPSYFESNQNILTSIQNVQAAIEKTPEETRRLADATVQAVANRSQTSDDALKAGVAQLTENQKRVETLLAESQKQLQDASTYSQQIRQQVDRYKQELIELQARLVADLERRIENITLPSLQSLEEKVNEMKGILDNPGLLQERLVLESRDPDIMKGVKFDFDEMKNTIEKNSKEIKEINESLRTGTVLQNVPDRVSTIESDIARLFDIILRDIATIRRDNPLKRGSESLDRLEAEIQANLKRLRPTPPPVNPTSGVKDIGYAKFLDKKKVLGVIVVDVVKSGGKQLSKIVKEGGFYYLSEMLRIKFKTTYEELGIRTPLRFVVDKFVFEASFIILSNKISYNNRNEFPRLQREIMQKKKAHIDYVVYDVKDRRFL